MGEPSRAVMAVIDHDGSGILRRDAGGYTGSLRQAGHTDQGSRAGPSPWVLANNDIAISMDGRGVWRDNVFVERLCCGLTILPTGSGSLVGNLRTLLLSGYPADDRTVNYLTIPFDPLTGARSTGLPSSNQHPVVLPAPRPTWCRVREASAA